MYHKIFGIKGNIGFQSHLLKLHFTFQRGEGCRLTIRHPNKHNFIEGELEHCNLSLKHLSYNILKEKLVTLFKSTCGNTLHKTFC